MQKEQTQTESSFYNAIANWRDQEPWRVHHMNASIEEQLQMTGELTIGAWLKKRCDAMRNLAKRCGLLTEFREFETGVDHLLTMEAHFNELREKLVLVLTGQPIDLSIGKPCHRYLKRMSPMPSDKVISITTAWEERQWRVLEDSAMGRLFKLAGYEISWTPAGGCWFKIGQDGATEALIFGRKLDTLGIKFRANAAYKLFTVSVSDADGNELHAELDQLSVVEAIMAAEPWLNSVPGTSA
jgi:hypothetical protein